MEVTTAPVHPIASQTIPARTTRLPSLGGATKRSRVDYGQRDESETIACPQMSSQ